MSISISYGLCARASTYLSLYMYMYCCATHIYIFTRGAFQRGWGTSLRCCRWPLWSQRWGREPHRAQWSSDEIFQVLGPLNCKVLQFMISCQERRRQTFHNGWRNLLTRWTPLLPCSNIYSRPYEGCSLEEHCCPHKIISHLENPGALKMWTWSWQPLKHKTRACGNTNTSGELQWSERLLFKTELMLLSRQFCMELNGLAVKLQAECKPETCTQVAILKLSWPCFVNASNSKMRRIWKSTQNSVAYLP